MKYKNAGFIFLIVLPAVWLSACLTGCGPSPAPLKEAGLDWPVYLGGNSGRHYSPLDQVTPENVSRLGVAWEYATGDIDENDKTQIQCNPLIIDGVLYGTSPKLKAFALDAKTGTEKWVFDPNEEVNLGLNVNRGVSYWTNGSDARILFTAGEDLFCLDAASGRLVETFGSGGRVSLKSGLGPGAAKLFVVSTSPGVIYEDKIIIGSRVSENANAAPGYIQAFNVLTGKLEWVFHTIPRPGEFGYDTWPEDAYQYIGGANSWAGMSLDEKRGIVYAPTGSAAFDFYGGNRKGANLFANCILALDANTGERIWHFQTTHHDLWDRDIPTPPALVTVEHNGQPTDAVAVVTKMGFVFLLDRETGEPLSPVEERPVPPSDIPGEQAWPTQPFPAAIPPFTRQKFTEEDITDLSDSAHAYVKSKLKTLRTGQPYIPPSLQGTIVFPEFDGGAGWGGCAFHPGTGLLVVNAKEIPSIITLQENRPETGKIDMGKSLYLANCAMCHGKNREGDPASDYPALEGIEKRIGKSEAAHIVETGKGGRMPGFGHLKSGERDAIVNYLFGIANEQVDPHELGKENNRKLPYSHTGYHRFYDQDGYPAIKPPWGTLTAIDLNEGAIKWQVPLGEYEELTARGIPRTGRSNHGGPVVTAGGLAFIAAASDEYFRAFDLASGEELWKYKLPAAGYATPSVYEMDGRQFIVIACGGGKLGTPSGDKYLAFALPE